MLVALLVLVAAILAITLVDRERTPERNVDDDLCPLDSAQITASATLLVDLSKPLYDTSSLSGLLHRVSGDLRMDEEIEVYAIAAQSDSAAVEAGAEAREAAAAAPMLMGRLCKPYNDADLLVGQAKDQRGVRRDCDDLPAQLPINLRDVAGRFCAARNDLQVRINALAAQAEGGDRVPGAELVEMLEGVRGTLLQRSAPRTLYVFSDMLQHAAWYSHFDLDWTQWSSADYLEASVGSSLLQESGLQESSLDVSIFYLPRQRVTESLRPRNAHQQFWRSFFQGANVHFEDLPALPAYAVQPLMRRDGALAARDREEFDRLVAETELLQAKIAEARSQLDEIQRRPAAANADTESAATEAQLRELESVLQAAQQEARPLDEAAPVNVAATPAPTPSPPSTEASEVPIQTPDAGLADAADAAQADVAVPAAAPQSDVSAPPVASPSATEAPTVPPIAETALARVPAAVGRPCVVSLKPRFLEQLYPDDRRVNYGGGVVVVDYLLDENGATVDTDVVWRREESTSTRPRSFDALAEDALTAVRSWELDFVSPTTTCSKRQRQRATFTYRSKCVGAPVPSCRTVRDDVIILSLSGDP